jgi:hypothetical protein
MAVTTTHLYKAVHMAGAGTGTYSGFSKVNALALYNGTAAGVLHEIQANGITIVKGVVPANDTTFIFFQVPQLLENITWIQATGSQNFTVFLE